MKPPTPPRVDHHAFLAGKPPSPSPRLVHWTTRIEGGWRPNRRVLRMGYDDSAAWYGVYIWEYLNVLSPLLSRLAAREGAA